MNSHVMVKLHESATAVARFNANADRTNLNCNRNPQNSKSLKRRDCYARNNPRKIGHMKTYKHLYKDMCSLSNLDLAFKKAKKGKTHVDYVKNFEENLNNELQLLHTELTTQTYAPRTLKRFTIRDPKTRVIHASAFRDRVEVHYLDFLQSF